MKVKEFLLLYQQDAVVSQLKSALTGSNTGWVHARGLAGSQDTVVMATLYQQDAKPMLIIAQDREEANYLLDDLQHLLESQEPQLFPTSYKRPYHYEPDMVDNANVLQRAEVLAKLNHKGTAPTIVVTYPEALVEKVINKKSLTSNTFSIKVGDSLDLNFIIELLAGYDFERSDFVYEPGQFSVRGGILDVFSYSGDLPYRIELFGAEVESIRTFDPETQLSVTPTKQFSLVPDVQTKLMTESRESFLNFWPEGTQIWINDYKSMLEVLDLAYAKAEEQYQTIKAQGGVVLVKEPDQLFEDATVWRKQLKGCKVIEFGHKFHGKTETTIQFQARTQPSFNKDFNKLTQVLSEHQAAGKTCIIAAEQPRQLERLQTIVEEIDDFVKFQPLYIPLRAGFEDELNQVVCYTDHQLFDRYHRFKGKEKYSKSKSLTIKELKTLKAGDYVTHFDHGVARFVGLERVESNGKQQEAVRLVFKDDDYMLVSIHALHKLSKYSGKEGQPPGLSKLGSQEWENKKNRVKKQVKDIARELIKLYAKRKLAPGFAYSPDGYLQAELESSFLYEDTPDQAKATADTKTDMEKPHPMDRLVCGDVGFGKTEVAIRAAFKAVCDSKQVAVLVPTTILAMQHYRTFRDRVAHLPCNVEYINRFKSTKQINETLAKLKEGKVDILIGTSAIVGKKIEFKDLGLLIIDEEQKFGVKVKDKLKEMKVNVDCLTLSATPIPRTLQYSMMGARDLSIIATPPPNRQPVTTEVHSFDEAFIRDAVRYELSRGGQVFFVHNRVSDIDGMANTIMRLVPDARVAVGHGQMDGAALENVMLKFMEGEYDVLVSTNIVESGLDIPNANTIIINNAHYFGMSDLHQMRGRVGRSNRKAFCYLLTVPVHGLTSDARKRLKTLEEFSELGDGFKVAMRDLDIRGAGDILGAEQSGFITDIGFDAYHKILDDAIKDLKEDEFKALFADASVDVKALVQDCQIETDLEILIPEAYVANISERLSLYAALDSVKDEAELTAYISQLTDRFGPPPPQVNDLVKMVKLRWSAERIGFEKLSLKGGDLRGQFDAAYEPVFQSAAFGRLIAYVQANSKRSRLKDAGKKLQLVISQVGSVDDAIALLEQLGQD